MDKEAANVKQEISPRKGIIHLILVHSYLTFFYAIILGLIFDLLMPTKIFNNPIFQYVGILMIMGGTMIIYWAQWSSRKAQKIYTNNVSVEAFQYGAYKYLRSPTYIGLFIMTMGLGFVIDSLFSVIFVMIAHLITKFVSQKQEEKILIKKYGQIYIDYKKKVKNWL